MAHTIKNKKKLLDRVKRIKGQIDAAERALEEERECVDVLHIMAACHGAINSLTTEILEDHLRHHLLDSSAKRNSRSAEEMEELIEVLKRYMK